MTKLILVGTACDLLPILLADLVKARLPLIENSQEHTRAKRVLNTWLKLLPAGIKVEQVFTPHIQVYVEKRQEKGQSSGSIYRELNIISATLHAARDIFPVLNHWLPPNIPRPKLPKTQRERIITDDEYRKILEYLQRPRTVEEKQLAYQSRIRSAHLLRFALLTGMRPNEIFELRWDDIDWEGSRVRVRGTKTAHRMNSPRYVPPTPSVLQILQARQADRSPALEE